MEVLIKWETSLNSLVGIWSKIQVDGVKEAIVVRSWSSNSLNTNQVLRTLLKLLYLMIHQ